MSRPNLLLFMPDQLRADCVGCFGNPVVQTPNIDALAARGTRFANAYVNHPVCSPSRVSLMTGWYPHTRGHRTLTHLVQPHEPNLLKYLKEGGYHVAWAGARGDVFAPGVTEASTHFCGWTTRPHREQMSMGPQFPEGSPLYNAFYHGQRPGDEIWLDFDEAAVRTAIDWLADRPAEPWCLWIPLVFPHLPFEVEDPWYSQYSPADMPDPIRADESSGKPAFHAAIREKYGTHRLTPDDWALINRVYYGMISRVDSQLGRVLDAVERAGAAYSTVTAFFTDHGEYAGDFGLVEKWPSGLDNCLVQNPLVIAGPGIRSGQTADTFSEMVDLLPTLLELAEIEPHHTHFGESLVPVLRDGSIQIRDAAFSEGGFHIRDEHLFEQATGEYYLKSRLQHERPETAGKAVSVRTREHTYVYRLFEDDELYDRNLDPMETRNLITAPEYALIANAMRARVLDWLMATSDVIPWEGDPRFPKVPNGPHSPFSPTAI